MKFNHHIPTNKNGKPNRNYGFPPLKIIGDTERYKAEKARNEFYEEELKKCGCRKEKTELRAWILKQPSGYWLELIEGVKKETEE